jgi:hypothetical protein
MLPKIVLDKTISMTFNKALMKQIQNNQKFIGKSIPAPAYGFEKSQEKKISEPKVSRLLPNLCDFQ